MSIEKVKEYLSAYGYGERVIEFDVSTATVPLAAAAAGVSDGEIAKTMSFILKDSSPLIVVAAGDVKIDNAKFKACFSNKPKFMSSDELVSITGHRAGGVCPFALPGDLNVYLDVSLKRFEYVYPAAGNDASAVKLTTEELYSLSNAKAWVDVCKIPLDVDKMA